LGLVMTGLGREGEERSSLGLVVTGLGEEKRRLDGGEYSWPRYPITRRREKESTLGLVIPVPERRREERSTLGSPPPPCTVRTPMEAGTPSPPVVHLPPPGYTPPTTPSTGVPGHDVHHARCPGQR